MSKSATRRIRLPLGERSYDIVVGNGLVRRIGRFLPEKGPKHAIVIADRRLGPARARLRSALKGSGWTVAEIPVTAGEGLKDFRTLYPLYGKLLAAGARRDSTLIALGGGSVGDAAGFLASTYLRGIRWIGIPTTLLAQVDSSVGGKTAVNHDAGKNLIGTFHQPVRVLCDVELLGTLSRRELISGLGEAVKYGLIYDPAFFSYLRRNWERALEGDPEVLTAIVHRSIAWKAKAVSRDEFDRLGVREFLNFGHTVGHALEKVTAYRAFQHGEAVLWGMRFALALSSVTGGLPEKRRKELDAFLGSIRLPRWPANASFDRVLGPRSPLYQDKKVRGGRLHFVLLRGLGRPYSSPDVTSRDLRRALALLQEAKT